MKARNLTAYGGSLAVATMLGTLGFGELVEQILSVKRRTRSMPMFEFNLRWCWPGMQGVRARFVFVSWSANQCRRDQLVHNALISLPDKRGH